MKTLMFRGREWNENETEELIECIDSQEGISVEIHDDPEVSYVICFIEFRRDDGFCPVFYMGQGTTIFHAVKIALNEIRLVRSTEWEVDTIEDGSVEESIR